MLLLSRLCFPVLLTLAPMAAVQAQIVIPRMALNGSVMIPRGAFAENLTSPGYGLNLFGGIHFRDAPVFVGVEGSIYEYGREYVRVPISYAIPDVSYRLKTVNNLYTGHLVLRLQPSRGRIMPYGEGLVGIKVFATESSLERHYGDFYTTGTNHTDSAFSYGVGGGVDIFLSRSLSTRILLHLGVRYLKGRRADYLLRGAISRTGGNVAYKVDQSTTDALVPNLGISFSMW